MRPERKRFAALTSTRGQVDTPRSIDMIEVLAWIQIGVALVVMAFLFLGGIGESPASAVEVRRLWAARTERIASVGVPYVFFPAIALLAIRRHRPRLLRWMAALQMLTLFGQGSLMAVLPLTMLVLSMRSSASRYFGSRPASAAPSKLASE